MMNEDVGLADVVEDTHPAPVGRPHGVRRERRVFQPRERQLVERRPVTERETVLRAGDLELDLLNRRASRGGVAIDLTHREFEVLEYLVRHKNQPVTRDMLGRDVWKEPGYAQTNVIEVYINLLRKKIEADPSKPEVIKTIRGVGYLYS